MAWNIHWEVLVIEPRPNSQIEDAILTCKPLRAVGYYRVSLLLGQSREHQRVPVQEFVKYDGYTPWSGSTRLPASRVQGQSPWTESTPSGHKERQV
ncbi:MAG: hypothetical protein NT027_04325 [Proteobacteria bacterium]|nr:hypothetical protein [Pseudomonadota bacterium]